MTDPKSELGERFDDRRADAQPTDTDAPDSETRDETDDAGSATQTDTTAKTETTAQTRATGDSYNTGETGETNQTSETDQTGETGQSKATGQTEKPGPNPDPDATRNRRQLAMYLSAPKAEALNSLYDRLDGQSKIAGDGGIEKHADFMEALVEFAIEHEDELADKLGIDT